MLLLCGKQKNERVARRETKRLTYKLKGSVFTAFVVRKYFSCIKKHLILCFDETKMVLKPLIMLF